LSGPLRFYHQTISESGSSKSAMRLLIGLLAMIATTRASAQSTYPTPPQRDFKEARDIILKGMARDSLPGLAIAVAHGDTILWEEGFGWADRDARIAVTPATPFYTASVTKTITATAAMILYQKGVLNLDRAANEYLRASPVWSPVWDSRGVTARRLLNHTSGLTTFDLGCAADRPACRVPSMAEIIRQYGAIVWRAGDHFDYSNLGYDVLGDLLSRASAHDLASLLRDEVFRPLGMMHSSLGVDPTGSPLPAIRYSSTRGALPRQRSLAEGGVAFAASNVYASAHDLILFGMFHMKSHMRGTGTVLPDALIDSMQLSTVPADGGQRYGLGWWVEDDRFGYRSVLAQGGTDAAQAWLRIIPSEHIAVVLLANKGVGFPSDVVDAVIDRLLPTYAQRRAAKLAQPPVTTPTPAAGVPLDTAFRGTWVGSALTGVDTVSLEIALDDTGAVRARIGSRQDLATGRARRSGPSLRIGLIGDFETSDTTRAARTTFYLMPHDQELVGTVTTRPPSSSELDGRISYFVELRRRR
jgi:CubicO group peptidase (beta-lactamase class C family)